MNMNAKERVRACVAYQRVDRAPAGLFGTHMEYQQGLAKYIGAPSVEAMYRALNIDVWHSVKGLNYRREPVMYRGHEVNLPRALYDEHNPFPPFAGLNSADELPAFPPVCPDDFEDVDYSEELDSHSEFFICGGINAAVFHNYLYMCGQLDGLCYLKTMPDTARVIITMITDYWAAYLTKLLRVARGRVDMIENCNDFGTQTSMFISRDDFNCFFRPQLKRLYDIVRREGLVMMQHSCGAVSPILDDFIDMGAQVLNPIQVTARDMELTDVVDRYRGRIAFYGGIDTQYVLPQGPEELIRDTTSAALKLFGKGGGFILSASQGFMDDIPFRHAAAMLDPALRR